MIEGRTILITGGSRGLGRQIVGRLADDNQIVSVSRSAEGFVSPNVFNIACDIANPKELADAMSEVVRQYSDIDVLINNAALLGSHPLTLIPDGNILAQVHVNLLAPMLITKRILKRMMSRKSGRIVNIISMSHRLCKPGDSVYAATKAGLEIFGKIVNTEAHPYGITANSIAISAIETGMLEQIIRDTPEKIRNLIPHGALADIDDVMGVLEFFCQEKSGDIGGQTVHLGGV